MIADWVTAGATVAGVGITLFGAWAGSVVSGLRSTQRTLFDKLDTVTNELHV